VDVALCFGWIDAVRKSIDEYRYFIRFTGRKPTGVWSEINIKKVDVLTKKGLMKPAGLAAFALRKEKKSRIHSYEKEAYRLRPDYLKKFKANKKAWTYFQSLAPSYKKLAVHWVMDAKQETTRQDRPEC
jgi:uncharacterized protein YdeI (YjbR/CyaY-like superfamily)